MFALFLILGVGIILYNLFVNLSNISIIIEYCYSTNTLDKYWSLFFKNCISGRAIYSSIIAIILAFVIFLFLLPIVVIRGVLFKQEFKRQLESGYVFDYSNVLMDFPNDTKLLTNISDYENFEAREYESSASLNFDAKKVVDSVKEQCSNKKLHFRFKVQQEMYLPSGKTATAPILFYIEDEVYPVYFIYNELQAIQYNNISKLLSDSRFKNTIYFSVLPMEKGKFNL